MKKFLLTTLIMIAGQFTLSSLAQAQTGAIVVNINQDFVAAGKTFPAGTYKVSQDSSQALVLRGEQGSAFLLPSMLDASAAGKVSVKLTREDGVYYLTEVSTDRGVYTIPEGLARTGTAEAKNDNSNPRSESN